MLSALFFTLTANVYFSVGPSYNVDDPTVPKVAVVKLCQGTQFLTNKNNFGADAVSHGCVYITLKENEVETLGNALIDWKNNPYIDHLIYVKQVQ